MKMISSLYSYVRVRKEWRLLKKVRYFFAQDVFSDVRSPDILILAHLDNYGYRHEGKIYAPLTDSLYEILVENGYHVLNFLKPFSFENSTRFFYRPFFYNRKFVFAYFFSKLINIASLGFFGKAEYYRLRKKLWKSLLVKIRPGVVIGIQPDASMCEAARELEIPIFDYQHGVISVADSPYGRPLSNSLVTAFPSGFLCWDEASKLTILDTYCRNNAAPGGEGLLVENVGHLWMQRFLRSSPTDKLVRNASVYTDFIDSSRPVILVTLQPGLHIYYYDGENRVICKSLEDVVLATVDRINWVFRLHPIQMIGSEGEYVEKFLSERFSSFSNIEWRISSQLPLPVLLSKVDLHITDMSSTVIEASWFGIPSAMLNPFLKKGEMLEGLFANEMLSGYAYLVNQDKNSIFNWIDEKSSMKKNDSIGFSNAGILEVVKRVMAARGIS